MLPAKMCMSGARCSSSWVAYEPVHKMHRAGVEDLHVRRSPRRPRDTTWSSSSITAFARKWVRVGRVACLAMRAIALSRYLVGEPARKPRTMLGGRGRRAERANVNATVQAAFAVTLDRRILALDLGVAPTNFACVIHARTRVPGSGSVGWAVSYLGRHS